MLNDLFCSLMPVVPPAERSDKGIAVPDCMAKIIRFIIQTKLLCKFLCTEIAFLTFPIRNETTSHPIRVIFRHIGKTRKPPCRERVAFFLLFPSIYSFAEEACAHIIYIYIPTAITMAAISDFILSVLWGATAILSPVLCQLHCRHPQ